MNCKLFLFSLAFLSGCSSQQKSLIERAEIPFVLGEMRTVIEASPSADSTGRWFTNDHCFIEDKQGTLHWFGINDPYPPEGKELYRYHPYLGHATTTGSPLESWKREKFALDESAGTEYLGAPYVVWHEESGRYAMVVETWRDTRRLEVYWSDDLYDWQETAVPILPETLWVGTRDPHIMRGDDGKYWIHVVATGNKGVGESQVLRIRTSDFVTFDEPETILGIQDCTWATLIESPFLVERNGLWYLFFTYAHRRYAETVVVVSDNPDSFDYYNNTLTTMFSHAAEIFEYKGKVYFTSCGPEDEHYLNSHGVSMAELRWLKQN
ncbi:MAG: hypothetical protein R3Y19_06990 [Rikenellaceae bacterium]